MAKKLIRRPTIQWVMETQRRLRHTDSLGHMNELMHGAHLALVGKYACYRQRFRLGTMEWIDNQHELTAEEMAKIDADGLFLTESATFTADLNTFNVYVVVNRFNGYISQVNGQFFASTTQIKPGGTIIGRKEDGSYDQIIVPGDNPFGSLKKAYDWVQSSPFASNGELPVTQLTD